MLQPRNVTVVNHLVFLVNQKIFVINVNLLSTYLKLQVLILYRNVYLNVLRDILLMKLLKDVLCVLNNVLLVINTVNVLNVLLKLI